jgi:hypothetical protein
MSEIERRSDRLRTGDRVTLASTLGPRTWADSAAVAALLEERETHLGPCEPLRRRGTVSYERSGFVLVRWDGGSESLVWGADLTREETEKWSQPGEIPAT